MARSGNDALNLALSEHGQEAYAWLQQVRDLKMDIQRLDEAIEETNMKMTSIPSSSAFSGTKVQASQPKGAGYEQLVAAKDYMERERQKEQEQFDRLKEQATKVIWQYTAYPHRMLLLWYFLEGFTWKWVGTRIDRTERSVYRIRNEALEKIVLPDDAIWLDSPGNGDVAQSCTDMP